MEGRMTVCNMAIEAGARAGMIAPDDTTFAYLSGRAFAPTGEAWKQAVASWRLLATDESARYDRVSVLHTDELAPQVTWGTSPAMTAPITGNVPAPESFTDPAQQTAVRRALAYMELEPGMRIQEIRLDRVFIGSCTNTRTHHLPPPPPIAKANQVHPTAP